MSDNLARKCQTYAERGKMKFLYRTVTGLIAMGALYYGERDVFILFIGLLYFFWGVEVFVIKEAK